MSLTPKEMSTSTAKRSLKVAVLGPKGQCGSCVVEELLTRGHSVVGISRNPPQNVPVKGDYNAVAIDYTDVDKLAEAMSDNFDAIVCAYGPPLDPMEMTYMTGVETHCKIKQAFLKSSHSGSFVVIGGAGSLHHQDGTFFADEHDFPFGAWYNWPDSHFDYMKARAADHGARAFSTWIAGFKWARNNIEHPGWFSWLGRPLARWFMWRAKKFMTGPTIVGLILCSRVALHLYEGITTKSWSFLSPPWLLRDKGVRTGRYQTYVDSHTPGTPAHIGIQKGIYNEDMAVAIVDEVETNKLAFCHWTCTGPIDLKEW